MQKHHFLFLTNVKNTYSALLKFSNNFPNEFDFLVHSTGMEKEHYSDLRNSKIIRNRIFDDTIIILYLTGNLSLYIIDEFFKNHLNLKHKIIYVFPAVNLVYFRNNLQYLSIQQTIKVIKTKSDNYLLIFALMTEDNYSAYFMKLDEKYFPQNNTFNNLTISNKNLVEEILILSTVEYNKSTIYLVNEKYDLVKEAIDKIKFNPIEKLLYKTIHQEYYALSQFISQLPNLENITLINTGRKKYGQLSIVKQ